MMKKIFILFCSLAVCYCSFSQNQVYSGGYYIADIYGTVNYSYYEKENKRVYDGPFKFTNSKNTFVINGNFNNGLKSGIWEVKLVDFYDGWKGDYVNSIIKGEFVNGKLNGDWSINRVTSSKDSNSEEYRRNVKEYAATIKTKFDNGKFSGQYEYFINNQKEKMKGQFNHSGYADGIWTFEFYNYNIKYVYTSEFFNGVLCRESFVNFSTGKDSVVLDNTKIVKRFFQNYDSTCNCAILSDSVYSFSSSQPEMNEKRFQFFEKWAFLFVEEDRSVDLLYPFRSIYFDMEKTSDHVKFIEQEELRLKNEFEELQRINEYNALVTRQKNDILDLSKENSNYYLIIKDMCVDKINEHIQKYVGKELDFKGDITFKTDTSGTTICDFSKMSSSDSIFLKNLWGSLSDIDIKNVKIQDLNFATYARYKCDYHVYKGIVKIILKVNNNNPEIIYKCEEPNEFVDSQIESFCKGLLKGKYVLSYIIIKKGDKTNADIKVIK